MWNLVESLGKIKKYGSTLDGSVILKFAHDTKIFRSIMDTSDYNEL